VTDEVHSTIGEAGAVGILNMVSITQAKYDLLTPVASTLYVIIDEASLGYFLTVATSGTRSGYDDDPATGYGALAPLIFEGETIEYLYADTSNDTTYLRFVSMTDLGPITMTTTIGDFTLTSSGAYYTNADTALRDYLISESGNTVNIQLSL